MKWLLLIAGVGVGCADAPERLKPLSVNNDDGAFHVEGPNFHIDFGRPDGNNTVIPMPENIEIGGHPLLVDNSCNTEALVGVALYPVIDIVATAQDHVGDGGMVLDTNIEIANGLAGPAAVQLVVTYDVQYRLATGMPDNPMNIGMDHFAGATRFTIFANGRIVRFDDFVPFTETPRLTPRDIMGCHDSGNMAVEYFLTSFWAFKQGGVTVDDQGQATTGGVAAACTIYNDEHVGVASRWPDGNTRFDVNDVASHVYDLVPGGMTSIDQGEHTLTSALLLSDEAASPSDCQGLVRTLDDPTILIDDLDLTTGLENGVYEDDRPHDGPVDIRPANAPIPPGFAVLLDLGDAAHADVVRDPPGSDPAAIVQRVDPTHVLFVFRDGLVGDESVTIDPF